jgi:uncharacterized membrane protein
MNFRALCWSALAIAFCFASQPSNAADTYWRICNKTPEELQVAVAFNPGNGQHVSKGYYNLKACGGCANIGSFGVKGVWYRATSLDGTARVEGNDLFCVHLTSRFQLGSPNDQGKCSVSTSPNSQLVARGFHLVRISGGRHTTNIVGGASGRTCID